MCFSPETERYREAVQAGVLAAGYRPVVADEDQYTGFVMDRIVHDLHPEPAW